ncbi:MAG: hypothetical protein WCW02_02680 [Candidatus Buchananbacteria bacterium]
MLYLKISMCLAAALVIACGAMLVVIGVGLHTGLDMTQVINENIMSIFTFIFCIITGIILALLDSYLFKKGAVKDNRRYLMILATLVFFVASVLSLRYGKVIPVILILTIIALNGVVIKSWFKK